MGNQAAKGISVNAKTLILILIFLMLALGKNAQ